MFNRTLILQNPDTVNHNHTTNTTVVEKRAPTDESIRLAREYEEKAWERAKTAITKDLPNINAKALIDHDVMRNQYMGCVKLNGHRIDFDLPVNFSDGQLYEEAAQAIGKAVLHMILTGQGNARGL